MKKKTLLAAAISGVLLGAGAAHAQPVSHSSKGPELSKVSANPTADAKAPAKHGCKGKNDCKGQGGCKTDKNACKGQNECKGKGGCATDGSKMPE